MGHVGALWCGSFSCHCSGVTSVSVFFVQCMCTHVYKLKGKRRSKTLILLETGALVRHLVQKEEMLNL